MLFVVSLLVSLFTVQIIGGRHFTRQGKGAVTSMFVDIEIIGAECDCCKMKTTTVRKCDECMVSDH